MTVAELIFPMIVVPIIVLFLVVVLAIKGYWMAALLTFAGFVLAIALGFLMNVRIRNVTKRWFGKNSPGESE